MRSRRNFIKKSAVVGTGIAMMPSLAFGIDSSVKKLKIGLIGVGLRGTNHLNNLLLRDDVLITAICDVDPARISLNLKAIEKAGGKKPEIFGENDYDYRNLLASKEVDAVIIATPFMAYSNGKRCNVSR